uniref:Uncharacterized protein n=1 Tax=Rhizophora mucronata TaxID=61149 RepID=A0A2P2PXK3_RHIMU
MNIEIQMLVTIYPYSSQFPTNNLCHFFTKIA